MHVHAFSYVNMYDRIFSQPLGTSISTKTLVHHVPLQCVKDDEPYGSADGLPTKMGRVLPEARADEFRGI